MKTLEKFSRFVAGCIFAGLVLLIFLGVASYLLEEQLEDIEKPLDPVPLYMGGMCVASLLAVKAFRGQADDVGLLDALGLSCASYPLCAMIAMAMERDGGWIVLLAPSPHVWATPLPYVLAGMAVACFIGGLFLKVEDWIFKPYGAI